MKTLLTRWAIAPLFALATIASAATEPASAGGRTSAHPIPTFALQMTDIVCDVLVNPEFEISVPPTAAAIGCSKQGTGAPPLGIRPVNRLPLASPSPQ